jgi:hypothetical protein
MKDQSKVLRSASRLAGATGYTQVPVTMSFVTSAASAASTSGAPISTLTGTVPVGVIPLAGQVPLNSGLGPLPTFMATTPGMLPIPSTGALTASSSTIIPSANGAMANILTQVTSAIATPLMTTQTQTVANATATSNDSMALWHQSIINARQNLENVISTGPALTPGQPQLMYNPSPFFQHPAMFPMQSPFNTGVFGQPSAVPTSMPAVPNVVLPIVVTTAANALPTTTAATTQATATAAAAQAQPPPPPPPSGNPFGNTNPTPQFMLGQNMYNQFMPPMFPFNMGMPQYMNANPTASNAQHMPALPMPRYSGRNDQRSPSDFLVEFERYAQSINRTTDSLIATHMTVVLENEAARWWALHKNITLWKDFTNLFLAEFASFSYKQRLLRDLDYRTQDPDEPLSTFVHTIAEFYRRLGGTYTEHEKVERALNQMHPEYRHYTYGRVYQSLRELSLEALKIQDAVLQSRLYVRPPAANDCVEPSLSFGGAANHNPSHPPPIMQANISSAQVSLSALDPLRRRLNQAEPTQYNTGSRATRESRPRDQAPRRAVICYRCQAQGHLARNCTTPVPIPQNNTFLPSKNTGNPSQN